MEEMNVSEAFKLVKPICNHIVKEPRKGNISELKGLFKNISSGVLTQLFDIIIFPLELHLSIEKWRSETRYFILDCMKELFHNSQIKDVNKLYKLFSIILYQIYDSTKPDLVGDFSEELKQTTIECITSLVKSADSDVVYEMYEKKYAPKLGQGMFIAMQLAQHEESRSLRIAAIECVMTLSQVHSEADTNDILLHHQVGDIIMIFLPGIVKGMHMIANYEGKQGHQVIMKAVRAWGQIIALVMDDGNNPPNPDNAYMQYSAEPVNSDEEEDPLHISFKQSKESMTDSVEKKKRTRKWYKAAAKKLVYSVKAIAPVHQNSHWKVRLEFATQCTFLLSRCCVNLQPCIMYLVEILITLSEDENEKVSEASKNGIKIFSEKFELEQGKSFVEMLEDHFYTVVSRLPRLLHAGDETEQLAALRLLTGYIKLLGVRRLPQLLSSASHLNRLMSSLLQAFELENAVTLLEDYTLRDLEANYIFGQSVPWKQFRYFVDSKISTKMSDICYMLGRYGDAEILTYHLLDLFHKDPYHRKEIILLLNEILHGAAGREDVDLEPVVENVLTTYLEPSVWDVRISVEADNKDTGVTLKEAQSNVVQACLLVEGVGKMAKVLGPKYLVYLFRTVYLIFERAGSANGLIAAAGMAAANDVASAFGLSRAVDLVTEHADYFSFQVISRLRRVEENPGVLDVLNVVLKYSGMNMLPYLEEIFTDVLLQSCDTFQQRNALSFMRVFYTFVASVRQWSEEEKSKSCQNVKESETDLDTRTLEKSQVVNELLSYIKCKKLSENLNVDDEVKEEAGKSESNEVPDYLDDEQYVNKKKKLPLHINMTVCVLKRAVNFLPTRKKELKLLVLLVLQEGLLILEDWENELLPIAHAIWSPFVDRFNEISDPLVVNRSFGLLCVLARTAKDFIRSRTLKNVLPSICQFLNKSAAESKKKDKGSSYRFTQVFKLQKELLNNLGDLADNLKLQERHIYQILNAACPYLSSFQPLPLQDACVRLFKQLAYNNPDMVWLKIVNIWSPDEFLSSSVAGLKTIKIFKGPISYQEEFKKNAQVILNFLNMNREQ